MYLKRVSLPCVRVLLPAYGTLHKSLVDTGAGLSAISRDLVNKLGCEETICEGNISLANGMPLHVTRKVRIECRVGDR